MNKAIYQTIINKMAKIQEKYDNNEELFHKDLDWLKLWDAIKNYKPKKEYISLQTIKFID